MAKKSAFESLGRLMEDGEGDLNIDVTIIADADAETAEEIIEVQEQADEQADADAIVETEEEAQQEAEDMAEMAAVLRQHGLTPGMAAVMQVTMPLAAYGITMPALESLDSTGRNMATAERIAAALEASSDGFWEGTKKFFRNIWEKIKGFFAWVASKFGDLEKRVKRAKDSLKDKSFDSERAKDKKFKALKKSDVSAMSNSCAAIQSAASNASTALGGDGAIGNIFTGSDIKAIADGFGIELKKDEKNEGKYTGIEKTEDDFVKTDDKEMTAEEFGNCKSDSWKAQETAVKYMRAAEESKKLNINLSALDKWSKRGEDSDAKSDTKDAIAAFRKECALLLKVQGRANKIIVKYCNAYISACGVARACATLK